MAKINVYQIVNAPKISSAAPPEIKSVGAALNANTRSINSLGKSFSSIAALSGGLRNVAVASLKESQLREVQERRAKQREEDRKREEDFENRKSLIPTKDIAKQKKPGGKEKSWLEKTFGGLFGWLEPLARGAIALFGFILASKAFKEIQRILNDPTAQAKITKFFEKLKFVWNKIFDFGNWLIKDNLIAGFNNVFGKDKTAVERLKGLGQMLIGIVGLSALLNPFGLMMSVMQMMTARHRQMNSAALKLRQREQRLIAENERLKRLLKNQKNKNTRGPQSRQQPRPQQPQPRPQGRTDPRQTAAAIDQRIQQGAIQRRGSGNQTGSASSRMTPQQMLARQMAAERMQRANPGLVQRSQGLPQGRFARFRQGIGRSTLPTASPFSVFNRGEGAKASRLSQSFARAQVGQAGPIDNLRLLKKGFINKRTAFKNLSRSAGRGFLRGIPRLASGVYNAPGRFGTAFKNRVVQPVKGVASGALRGLGLSANAVKGVLGTVKNLFGRVPWLGVLLTGIFELFEVTTNSQTGDPKIEFRQERMGKAMYKMAGAALGGVIGSFIPIPVIGTLLGTTLGAYGGEMLYMLASGTEPSVVGQIIMKDAMDTLKKGQQMAGMVASFVGEMLAEYVPKINQWVSTRIERLYTSLNKFKLTDFVHESLRWVLAPLGKLAELKIPNPLQFLDPLGMATKAYDALFTEKPITDGKLEQPSADLPKVKPGDVEGLSDAAQDALGSEIDQTKTLSSQVTRNYGYKVGQNYFFHHKGVKYRAKLQSDGWHFYYDATLFQNKGALSEIPVSTSKNVWLLNAFINGIKNPSGAVRGRNRGTAHLDFYSSDDLNTMKGIGKSGVFDFPDVELTNKQQAILDNIRKKHISGSSGAYYRRDGDGRYLGSNLEAATINLMRMLEYGSGSYNVFKSFPTGAAPSVQRPDGLTPPGEVTAIDAPVDDSPSVTSSVSLAGGKEKAILDLIASVEAPSYDSVNRSKSDKKVTECTISEIVAYRHLGGSGTGAAGRYQHMPQFLAPRAQRAGFDGNTVFTPGVQDKITIVMLNAAPHNMQAFLAKKMSAEAFGSVLAGTWRGFPQGPVNARRLGGTEDQTYADGAAGRNAAKNGYKWKQFLADLQRIQGSSAPNQGDGQNLNQVDASVGGVDLTPYLNIPDSGGNDGLNLTAQHGDSAAGGPVAKDPGFNAGAGDKTKRIFLHWTGGFHTGTSSRYHTTFTGDGRPHRNTKDYGVAKNNHTGGANSNSVGLSIAAMGHKGMTPSYYDPQKGFAESPPTVAQLNAMALEAARLAHAWGWTESTIQSNVKTHGEWERFATSNNLLPGAPQRWDLDQLRPGQPFDPSKIMSNGGKEMRALITAYYRKIVQQEKGGNGLGQDGQALQPSLNLPKGPDGKPVAGTLMDGVLVVPPSLGNGNVGLTKDELIQMVKLLSDGSLQAFQAPKGQMGGIMEALGQGLNLAQAAAGVVTTKAGELFRRAKGALQGGGTPGDGTKSPSSDPTQIPGDNPYGLQSQLDKDGNPIGFGEFARSQAPMDTPLTDTYNTLHKQWEAVLGIDPDGDGYKPRDVDRSDIFRNDYGGRTLSVEQGLGILFKRLGDENQARKGTTGIGPIADGDVYGSLIPSYSVGGKMTPMPNNLEGFFFGKIFKSIGKAISGAFNAVKNAVTSITSNPIFKVVTTAVSIFVPALAPVIAGINAVSSLMQGDILGAVVGGVGALGGMFPGTFGTEAGTFWSGLNKTFGEGLGGVMKGFLTGGIGGAIGSIGGMLPEGMKAFFSGMGSFMDKNPMVKNILSAGIANIPGLGSLLGPALEGAGLSPTAAIDQQAQGAGTLISSLLNVGLGLVSKAMGMEQAAISVGALPAAFGMPPARSAMMDPKNEALRQMSQMGPIEVVHVPVIIEKLVAIREPVPIVTTRVVQKPAPQKTA